MTAFPSDDHRAWHLPDWLCSLGIDHVFAVAGIDVTWLLESLRRDRRIRLVAATHEFVAGSMAEGFVRRSGRPAAVLVCGGPGEAVLLPSVLHGGVGDAPVLWITGIAEGAPRDTAAPSFGLSAAVVQAAGLCAVTIRCGDELTGGLGRAADALRSGRPALLQISDAAQRLPFAALAPVAGTGSRLTGSDSLGARTVLAVGSGSLPWAQPIRELSHRCQWPIITDMTARGVVAENSALALGHLGFLPSPAAVAATDPTGPWAATRVVALAASDEFLRALRSRGLSLDDVPAEAVTAWLERHAGRPPAHEADAAWLSGLALLRPRREVVPHGDGLCHALLVREIADFLGPRAVHVADAGIFHQAVTQMVEAGNARTVLSTAGLSLMGWSLGAAQGAALADPAVPVIAWLGDGSFLMHGLALATAARERLPVIHVLAENGVLGSPRSRHAEGPEDPAALPAVDLAAVAVACGVRVQRVATLPELRAVLPRLRNVEGPVVLLAAVGSSDPCVRGRATGFAFLDGPA